jgi:hypothetical protein
MRCFTTACGNDNDISLLGREGWLNGKKKSEEYFHEVAVNARMV